MSLHSLQSRLYDIAIYTTWFLYAVAALGISAKAPQYLGTLNTWIKVYVSLFLIYRFNPFRRVKFTALDAKLTFSAGVFLLATSAVNGILEQYLEPIKKGLASFV